MTEARKARLKVGVAKGLLASGILVGVIWSFGYMTGYRLGLPLLPIVAVLFGIVTGAQAYAVEPVNKNEVPDEMLAALQAKEEARSARRR